MQARLHRQRQEISRKRANRQDIQASDFVHVDVALSKQESKRVDSLKCVYIPVYLSLFNLYLDLHVN